MPRISQVSWPKYELRYGWLFDIQNYDELMGWWDNVRTGMAQKDFSDAIKYRDGKAHANSLAQLADLWEVSLVDALTRLNTDIGNGLRKVLDDEGRLFINGLGGYFGYIEEFQISGTRDTDVWALPEESLRIISWPGGTHFYAKIGNEDVVFDGEQKWDTKTEAEAAGKKYLQGKRR